MIIIKNKKLMTGVLIGSLALLCFASGAIASSHLTKITAYLNSAISVELKGKTLNLSESQPITYKNTTYLPLRTIAQATGLDVSWDQEKQRVYLNDKTTSSNERRTFSKNDVEFENTHYADLLLEPKNITFSNKQFNEVIKVTNVNTTNKGFKMTFPEGTQSMGVTFVVEGEGLNYDVSYTIYDMDENVVSEGKLRTNTTTYIEFELSEAGTTLDFKFKTSFYDDGSKTVYLVYDESWYE